MKIRIIGCGTMGRAIAEALSEQKTDITVYDKFRDKATLLAKDINTIAANDPLENLQDDDMLLLAMKPQDFEEAKSALQTFSGKFVVSVVTGISVDELKRTFPYSYVVRMIPNLAVRYGDGIVIMANDPHLESQKKILEETFTPLGMVQWIDEKLCSAATALTGSGPAFVYVLLEAMIDASIALGFSAESGYQMIKQMVGGAMTTLYESDEFPAALKWRIASPAGTTIAGIKTLESKGVRSALIEAFIASYQRAEELSK